MWYSRTARRIHRLTRTFAMAMVAASVLSAAKCFGGDDGNPTEPPAVQGSYALVTVNNATPPFTVPNTGSSTIVLQSASLTLADDRTYTVVGEGTNNGTSGTVLGDQGTYSQDGSQVTFHSTQLSGAAYVGVVDGNALTITLPALIIGANSGTLTFRFEK